MRTTIRALNEQRWTAIAFALAAFAITLLQSVAYFRLAGHTFAERAAFGYTLSLDAVANAVLIRPALHPETVAGYLELRAFDPLAVLFAAWATVSASASASRQPFPGAAAFGMSAVAAAVAACAGVVVGVSSGGESVGGLPLVETGLMLVALAVACYAISLVISLLSANTAAAPGVVAVGVMLTLFFVNSLSRVVTQLSAVRWLSPFRYYDLSTPLPQDGHFDVGGFAVLLAIALLGAVAVPLIPSRRGRIVATPLPTRFEPSRSRLLTVQVVRTMYPQRVATAAWCMASLALGIVLVGAARASMQDMLNLPIALPGLRHYIFVFYAGVLDQTWFKVSLLLLAALAFSYVAGWAHADRDGRLEAALSAPYSRPALLLERLAALGATAAILAAVGGLAVGLTSWALGLSFDAARLVEACVVLVLFSTVLASVGMLLTSWVPRAATTLLGFVLLAGFLEDQIGGALGSPGWAQEISPFRLAGAPLVSGLDANSVALLLLLTLAAFGSSILAFRRHDVGALSPTRSSQART